jgi:F-type H+-transporting ATPase subunit b
MELNWSTFILEIINFLVLLWLLKRFLYRPVLDVIARRREGIERQLEGAKSVQDEAQALQARYESRLADWERERQQRLQALEREIAAERAARLQAIAAEEAAAREKQQVLAQREAEAAARQLEEQALESAAGFAARLLRDLSGPELERQLVGLALAQLADLPAEQRESLQRGAVAADGGVLVTSAYELPVPEQERLRQALSGLAPEGANLRFEQDPELLAGLHISVGSSVLGLNLRDELQGFVQAGGQP